MPFSDFLQSLDDRSFFGAPPNILPPPVPSEIPLVSPNQHIQQPHPNVPVDANQVQVSQMPSADRQAPMAQPPDPRSPRPENDPVLPILPAATKTEQFLLTAADQASGSRDERLSRVIHSKYEAGLLKPYNYVKGYARLSRWMDRKYAFYALGLINLFFLTVWAACHKTQNNRYWDRYQFYDQSSGYVIYRDRILPFLLTI